MQIEGEILKPYRLYRIGLQGEMIGPVIADFDTLEEAKAAWEKARKSRGDRKYAIFLKSEKVWPSGV
ncbi:MAG TPA: hypothetical protein VFC45_13715 [Pseudolabrys sp.]|nr:hypothetical protein [Pseudolabrys sp.]